MSRAHRDFVLAIALASIVIATALAFGGVHRWASGSFELTIWLAAAAAVFGGARLALPRSLVVAGAALLVYLAIELVPLPPRLLAALSPSTTDIIQRTQATLERLREIPPPPNPAPLDAAASAASERVGRVGAEVRGPFPASWRPLAVNPFAAWSDLLRFVAYATAFALAASSAAPATLVRSLVAGGVVVAAVAFIQFATWNGRILWVFVPYEWTSPGDKPILNGPFVNPSHFALFLLILLGPGLAWMIGYWRTVRARTIADRLRSAALPASTLALGLALMVAGVLGSSSRGGLAGLVAALSVVAWQSYVSRRPRDRRPAHSRRAARYLERLGPALAGVLILIAGAAFAGSGARRTLDVRMGETVSAPDFQLRSELWKQTVPMLGDFRWVGTGAEGWADLFPRYVKYPMEAFRHTHAHNDYLEWMVEVGVVGIALTLLLLGSFARSAASNRSIAPLMRAGLAAGLVAAAMHELFDFGLRVPANALLFAVVCGLLCNPNWRRARGADEHPDAPRDAAPARRPALRTVVLLVALALAGAASADQIREFRHWSAIRQGSVDIGFASRDAETWEALGAHLVERGPSFWPAAGDCFRTALRLRPAYAEAFWKLSRIARSDEARFAALDAALAAAPAEASWRIDYARELDLAGRSSDAARALEEAAYRAPRLRAHPYLASISGTGRPVILPPVERGLRRALDERPDDPSLMHEVATFYSRFEAWQPAAELWERAAVKTGDWIDFGRRAGEAYAYTREYAAAEAMLRKSLAQAPGKSEIYHFLAMSVLRPQGRVREARETLALGIQRCRAPGRLHFDLYELETQAGDPAAAAAALERASNGDRHEADLQRDIDEARRRAAVANGEP